MPILTSVWNFIKAHWQAIALVIVLAVGYGWIRHMQSQNVAMIDQLNKSHQTEVDQINKAWQDEQAQHAQELQQYQQQVAQIQKEYADAQAALAAQQQVEQTQIVKKYGNDAKGLADLTASKFGFVVVVPPSQ